jgi:hypothetical protein
VSAKQNQPTGRGNVETLGLVVDNTIEKLFILSVIAFALMLLSESVRNIDTYVVLVVLGLSLLWGAVSVFK